MVDNNEFEDNVRRNIQRLGEDVSLQGFSKIMLRELVSYDYPYNFKWLGRPIIQVPQDIVAWQELIWQIKPDLIIETGIAHGGSLILSASILALLDLAESIEKKSTDTIKENRRNVIGIDIDIREHNRKNIETHPLYGWITMIQGSSTDPVVVEQVKQKAQQYSCILLCLDSDHTHEHVLAELEAYSPLVTKGSYCVVYDTGLMTCRIICLQTEGGGRETIQKPR